MLKTLLDLPEQQRNTWEIVVFEQRANIGGIWLPDPFPKAPPVVPETPLYPLLHTNTPVPFLAYPGLPFPKGTALFPSHEHVLAYFTRYSERFNLLPYMRFNHTILSASWHGSPLQGTWNVTYSDQHNAIHSKAFHHLIDATGVSQIPRIPHWRGEAEWLANKMHQRELVHSMWYRNPEKYSGRSVLIVGEGPSARDIASQLASVVQKLYVSIRGNVNANYDFYGPFPSNAILKPGISHFTEQSIVFVDTTHIGVDTVLLATGYELRKPFLDAGGVLTTDLHLPLIQTYLLVKRTPPTYSTVILGFSTQD
ncbi:hypothetical protein AMATHDRAFT_60358 [Amanita thiersii Skay4041]|uniref:FAD/NAD(P)-binding domain-containing protein n=1 Tax=Amanita thiersii Skay4041 TaxID=703135 RepID=A0A2A9NJU3_9AGAR|nr:hypothetical protein AMATHDRAFT_60358 [Amanita thiersii Skay4041]